MVIHRNTIITLHKGGESNTAIVKHLKIKRTTIWKFVKKFQETGSTAGRLGRNRKRSERFPQLIKSTREKMQQNPHRSVRKLAATAKKSAERRFQDSHELTQVYKAMRLERSCLMLCQIAGGMLPNLVFTDEKKFDIEQTVQMISIILKNRRELAGEHNPKPYRAL
ncbi:uncharacterized protein LOC106876097 [Octopus bimaculoides]|uniref:uncharacterized protein LOC106876097 n=1 Tax=Octopus bimaculoides TaxID=37653 RepID=UPI00071C6CAE|nr:uncharacterized protein LOC106876097 [Octopus bimaculoides]|eukprot:XP_014779991.1 PREDICTED: uncharacterized protein LOC106876097 [Octopus bimaculoides]